MRYLTPCASNALNSSLKCEFGVTSALHSIGLDHHLPGGGKNRSGTLPLPELHIEPAAALTHFADPLHDHRLERVPHIAHIVHDPTPGNPKTSLIPLYPLLS